MTGGFSLSLSNSALPRPCPAAISTNSGPAGGIETFQSELVFPIIAKPAISFGRLVIPENQFTQLEAFVKQQNLVKWLTG